MKNTWIKKFIAKIDERIKNSIAEDIDNITMCLEMTEHEKDYFQKLYHQRYKEHLEYRLEALSIKNAVEDASKIVSERDYKP